MIFYPQFFFFFDHQCFSYQEQVIAFIAADQCSFWVTHQTACGGKESPPAIRQGTMGLSLGKGPLLTTTYTHA